MSDDDGLVFSAQERRSMRRFADVVNEASQFRWRPIETAPKDGRKILGWSREEGWSVMWWLNCGPHGNWACEFGDEWTRPHPTHWKPLDAPPEEGS